MPIWRPNRDNREPEKPTQPPSVSTQIDKFLSHFERDGESSSPYGEISAQEQLTVPRSFIPPTSEQTAPQLPGMTSVPDQATTGEHITHADPTETDEAVKTLVELECFNLIPLYEQIGRLHGDKAKFQLERLIKLALQGKRGPKAITVEGISDAGTLSKGRVMEDLEFDISTKDSGALSDEVFKALVEKIFNYKGTLPPIGIGSRPKAYYMGRLLGLRGVSPNIKVYKDFLSELEARTAIETGITNALGSGVSVYTDQQIYIRYFNGTQSLGTFDKFAIYGDQRWAFNYVTENESFTHMNSIGTTVNIWENQSLTTEQITNQVELQINTTLV